MTEVNRRRVEVYTATVQQVAADAGLTLVETAISLCAVLRALANPDWAARAGSHGQQQSRLK